MKLSLKYTHHLVMIVMTSIYLISCGNTPTHYRTEIDLSGTWEFSLDTARVGLSNAWYLASLSDSIVLPGTTDTNLKGLTNHDTTTFHLNRVNKYEGPAWYSRLVMIPTDFEDKHIQLILERTKSTQIWIDGLFVGQSKILQSAQTFDLSESLTPGEHTITILVDNRISLTPYGQVHIYADDTQTNWNGIIGKIALEVSSKTYISDLQVFPDIKNKKANIQMEIAQPVVGSIEVELALMKTVKGETSTWKTIKSQQTCESVINLEYNFEDDLVMWDDYDQPLYTIVATIGNETFNDNKSVVFGMREFAVSGIQFEINDRKTFLRGKHEACVFPLTGHSPMDVESWLRVYRIAKSYGINHYRFHSYCPPEAAFTAADQVGMFLQAELPFWGGMETDSVADMQLAEGMAMLKAYANHPSFVMFSPGNEIWSGHDRVEKNIKALEAYDSRPLYTMGSNNNIGYAEPRSCSEFFVGARTPKDGYSTIAHTRLTHAFADSDNGGILNTQVPSTMPNFNYSVANMNLPIVSHEIGQYQIYPDYSEIDKYTGVLRAWNLEIYKMRLEKSGMLDQNVDFQKASGAWSALCYKAEMEAAIRTKGFAGFQLLDLQDFPGQGTALVGILDAFMDSKNVITREEWVQSCNNVTVLLEFSKYCWTNSENFQANVKIANYSNQSLNEELIWEVKSADGTLVHAGKLDAKVALGSLESIGEIKLPFTNIDKAEKLTLNLKLATSGFSNIYPIWVYTNPKLIDNDVQVFTTINDSLFAKLNAGQKVLLFPNSELAAEKSVDGLFPPDFWNYGMFKGISEWAKKPVSPGTLGILTRPDHPIFNDFPTDFHTNWQWFSIIKASKPLILNSTSSAYRPIVQVIDNLERNDKLGLIYEFKVGDGKLLICQSRLNEIMDQPEALQLYQSILKYMISKEFDPKEEMKLKDVKGLFI